MTEEYPAHIIFTIDPNLSEEESDRKLAEIEDLVGGVSGVEVIAGEYYPED